mgnify:CR=1 FL=1
MSTRKSAPIMGFTTFATTNLYVKSHRKPKFNDNVIVPFVAITMPFAVESSYADFVRGFGSRVCGNTHRSAAVSIRNVFPIVFSVTNKRRDVAVGVVKQASMAVVNDCPRRFSPVRNCTYMACRIFLTCRRNASGTSIYRCRLSCSMTGSRLRTRRCPWP